MQFLPDWSASRKGAFPTSAAAVMPCEGVPGVARREAARVPRTARAGRHVFAAGKESVSDSISARGKSGRSFQVKRSWCCRALSHGPAQVSIRCEQAHTRFANGIHVNGKTAEIGMLLPISENNQTWRPAPYARLTGSAKPSRRQIRPKFPLHFPVDPHNRSR